MAQDIAQLAQRYVALTRENTKGNLIWADVLGNVGLSSGFRPRGVQHVDPGNPMAYFQFCTMTLEVAAFPGAMRHPRAEASGIKSSLQFWEWASRQVREHIGDPNWNFADLAAKISVAFSNVFQRVGRRRYPPMSDGFVRSAPQSLHVNYGAQYMGFGAPV